jgi:hypothetical protein
MLQDRWGIDSEIADYFANQRKVPDNNLFWKNKRIYISGGFGFLTIPLMFDLKYKLGVSKQELLNNNHVSLMEEGFDQLKRYEAEEISFTSFLTACKKILDGNIKQHHLAKDLFAVLAGELPTYFQFETTHQSLARSDSFLFTLVDLNVTDEWISIFLPYWYALARPILLFDDFKDLQEDRQSANKENAIIELGNNAAGIKAAYELGVKDLEKLETINAPLAKKMMGFLKESLEYNYIRTELT